MILVTGAAGKTGKAVVRALVREGAAVRALVYRPQQVQAIRDLGAREAIVGDMRLPTTLEQAARGVGAVYHICPNMSPVELSIGRAILTTARTMGVQHFIYHSVLHPQTEAMPHHWQKLRVEEQLLKSGLSYTILQPAAYMQNVLAHWGQIAEKGLYPVPYAAETQLGMVDLEDVAAAAAVILTEPGHEGATYELAGPDVLSQVEVARILSQQLGRPVRIQVVPLDEWERQARATGMGEYQVEALVKMFRYYERHGFWGNPRALSCLLGRPPTSFEAFIERTVRVSSGVSCKNSPSSV